MDQPRDRVDPPDRRRRELIGTLELVVTLVVVLALIAFVVWFLFFAHNPLLR
jgi:F0F1-type ATP synthase membrane subunit c/vacuolar-type H+-ATPase subunit K